MNHQFETLAKRHPDRNFEFIAGKTIEKHTNLLVSEIGATIAEYLVLFLRSNQIGGVLTGADGGYIIGDDRYVPNVAYISPARQPQPTLEPYNPMAPDLAVEVLLPGADALDTRIKVVNYLNVGTTVWMVSAVQQLVEIYRPGAMPHVLGLDDTILGEPVLPGFELAVRDIFSGVDANA